MADSFFSIGTTSESEPFLGTSEPLSSRPPVHAVSNSAPDIPESAAQLGDHSVALAGSSSIYFSGAPDLGLDSQPQNDSNPHFPGSDAFEVPADIQASTSIQEMVDSHAKYPPASEVIPFQMPSNQTSQVQSATSSLDVINTSLSPSTSTTESLEPGASVNIFCQQPPLSTSSANASRLPVAPHPVVSFGFGGQLVVFFPSTASTGTSQVDVSACSAQGAIYNVRELMRKDKFYQDLAAFPGPLIITKGKGHAPECLDLDKYLSRVESPQTLSNQLNPQPGCHQSRTILWETMRLFYRHSGVVARADQGVHTSKSDSIESSMLALLKQHLKEDDTNRHDTASAVTDSSQLKSDIGRNSRSTGQTTNGDPELDDLLGQLDGILMDDDKTQSSLETTIEQMRGLSIDSKNPSQQDKRIEALRQIESHLMSGDTREAQQVAVQHKLWDHAFVLADLEPAHAYRNTVAQMALQSLPDNSAVRNIYLIAAQYPNSIFNSAKLSLTWRENLAVLLANPRANDAKYLVQLGDLLVKQGCVEAGHICYIMAGKGLEPLPSKNRTSRMVLVGGDHQRSPRCFASPAAIQMTEIYEFTLLTSFRATLEEFQRFKFQYSCMLADIGLMDRALEYINLINDMGNTHDMHYPSKMRDAMLEVRQRLRVCLGLESSTTMRVMDGLKSVFGGLFKRNGTENSSGGMHQEMSSAQNGDSAVNLVPSDERVHDFSIQKSSASDALPSTQDQLESASQQPVPSAAQQSHQNINPPNIPPQPNVGSNSHLREAWQPSIGASNFPQAHQHSYFQQIPQQPQQACFHSPQQHVHMQQPFHNQHFVQAPPQQTFQHTPQFPPDQLRQAQMQQSGFSNHHAPTNYLQEPPSKPQSLTTSVSAPAELTSKTHIHIDFCWICRSPVIDISCRQFRFNFLSHTGHMKKSESTTVMICA